MRVLRGSRKSARPPIARFCRLPRQARRVAASVHFELPRSHPKARRLQAVPSEDGSRSPPAGGAPASIGSVDPTCNTAPPARSGWSIRLDWRHLDVGCLHAPPDPPGELALRRGDSGIPCASTTASTAPANCTLRKTKDSLLGNLPLVKGLRDPLERGRPTYVRWLTGYLRRARINSHKNEQERGAGGFSGYYVVIPRTHGEPRIACPGVGCKPLGFIGRGR